jgi:hypothetical protein
MGSDLVYSILSPEWNADKTRVDKVRYGLQSHACSAESICAGRSLWRSWIYGGGWIWSIPVTTY